MNTARVLRVVPALVICLGYLIADLALGQTAPVSSEPVQTMNSQQNSQGNPNGATSDVAPAPLLYAPSLDEPGIKELGGDDNWFLDDVRLFSFGPVAVRSTEIFYGYSSANFEAGLPGHLSAAVFQTNLAYSKRLRRSLLVWQYNPRLLYSNGQVSLAAANQDASLNTLFAPTPHVTVGIQEAFTFYGPLNTFNDKTLVSSTNLVLSNPFLTPLFNIQQQTWLDSVSIPVTYAPSPTTTVQVSPMFNYVRTSEGSDTSADIAPGQSRSALDYGARMQLSHSLSLNETVGMFYTYQMDQQTGVAGITNLNSLGGSISRRLGPSLVVSADIGVSHYNGAVFTGWTMVGATTVTKTFLHSSLQANYGRDSSFTGIAGSAYNNHAWVTYTREIGRRAKWSAGGGYLSNAVYGAQANGEYSTVGVSYAVTPNVVWTASYMHLWETGFSTQLGTSRQSQFQFGLRWTPKFRTPN